MLWGPFPPQNREPCGALGPVILTVPAQNPETLLNPLLRPLEEPNHFLQSPDAGAVERRSFRETRDLPFPWGKRGVF